MALQLVDYLQGSFSLVFVVISLIIGFTILSKYSKYKSRLYLLVGISWIGVANPWFPDSISFLMNLIWQEFLDINWYFIIGNCFIPFALLAWLIAFTDMIGKKRQKLVVSLTIILSIAFEVIFFYLLFTNPIAIGVINPVRPFTVNFGDFILIYLIIVIIVMVITGVIFAQKSVKSDNKEVRVKGKLLRAAFITFTLAAIFDSLLGAIFENPADPILAIMVVVVRVLLIFSAIEFYGGFLLPRWMHSIFIREN